MTTLKTAARETSICTVLYIIKLQLYGFFSFSAKSVDTSQ